MRSRLLMLAWLLAATAQAAESDVEFGGHTKLDVTELTWPRDSALRPVLGSNSLDVQGDLRLILEWRRNGWAFDAAYQLVAVHSEQIEVAAALPAEVAGLLRGLPDDDRRLFNLSDVISDSGDSALLHRLDRLWVGYTSDKAVVRFGRQALSWGNGLYYAPMDLVNPFDPAAIDTEYKNGDDMLYVQYLQDNGNDVQAAAVFRRDLLSGDLESRESTVAVKYHGFTDEFEFDLLAADSYGDMTFGVGFSRGIGGAQWGNDIVVTETASDTVVQLVTNISYSWTLAGKNMSGLLEYHFNGFGQHAGDYAPASLGENPALLQRLTRGQQFTLGRHYIAGSTTMELTPLWSVTPVLLANVADPSALLQLTSNYSLGDNMTLLGSINLPIGPGGTEFGGIDSGLPGTYLSTGASVFAQFAWYF